MKQYFDVVVIGSQLSGIIAASLLAKRGRRVLLVDHGEETSAYHSKGFVLPLAPSLVPRLDASPQVQRVHRELGLGPQLRATSRPLEPAFQAILPKHRLDFRGHKEALIEDFCLEFPESASAVQRFFDRLFALDAEITDFLNKVQMFPPSSWRERWALRSALRSISHLDQPCENHPLLEGFAPQHPIRALLFGLLSFFGYLTDQRPSLLHAVRLLARYCRGTMTFENPLGGLDELLLKAARDSGVVVRQNAIVRHVAVEGRRVIGIDIEDEKLPHTAKFFVANTIRPFHELISAEHRHPKLILEDAALSSAGGWVVLNLIVRRDVIPCGMGQALFVLNGRRQPRGTDPADPLLFLRRYPALRVASSHANAERKATPGEDTDHEIVSVACPVSRSDDAHMPPRLNALRSQVIGRVRRVIPFLEDYLVDVSLPLETSAWDIEDGSPTRHIDPALLHPMFDKPDRAMLGVTIRSTCTHLKNLIHCGRDVLPGLGIEGEYVAGLTAANTLCNMDGNSRWSALAPKNTRQLTDDI